MKHKDKLVEKLDISDQQLRVKTSKNKGDTCPWYDNSLSPNYFSSLLNEIKQNLLLSTVN